MDNQHNCSVPVSHRIRLQSVWDPPPAGSQAWRRQFGRPAGIDPGVRVLLGVDSPSVASLTLNGVSLRPAPEGRWSHDVTQLLADRNEIVVVPANAVASSEPANAHGRVALPIEVGQIFLEILTPPRADQ